MPDKRTFDPIKIPGRYEALRREGMGKEKAARIANDRRKVWVKGGTHRACEEWNKEDLLAEVKSRLDG